MKPRYIDMLDDSSVISSNIIGGVMMMIMMANEYKQRNQILPKLLVL